MQAYHLACLCEKLGRQSLLDILEELSKVLLYASCKKIDKDGERQVKQWLYRLDLLFPSIEDVTDESGVPVTVSGLLSAMSYSFYIEKYSRVIGKSVLSKLLSEMELMMKELTPYSKDKQSLIKRESMVGKEFCNKKEELISMLLQSNSDPRVVILGKPGTGKSTLVWDALLDSRIQNNKEWLAVFNDSSYLNRFGFVLEDMSEMERLDYMFSANGETLFHADFFSKRKETKLLIISSLDHLHKGAPKISLPGLDEDESWSLFQKIAFTHPQSPLLTVGGKICRKCGKIPGVINIVASILSSKSTAEEWEHFLNVVMTSVPDPITTISSTIEFTKKPFHGKDYWGHYFAWCSLLPKDFEFRKDHLFHLWRAREDFTLKYGQVVVVSITEKELDYCFNEFLRRGYFLKSDTNGSTVSYKINHLVFELMKYVAGDDFCLVDKTTPEPNHKIIRHASFIVDPSWEPPLWLLKAKQLQSLLLWSRNSDEFIPLSKLDMKLARMTQIRTFYAEVKHREVYPAFLTKLKRLKYLRLGLVSSISLPDDIPALKKLLNSVDIRYINTKNLALNSVDCLTDDIFGEEERLALLIKFTTFKRMTVQYENWHELNLKQTNKILQSLNFQSTSFDEDNWRLASLSPRQSLESLVVRRWKGEMLPAWVRDEFSVFLHGLLSIQIVNCSGCQYLPGFNTLPLLRSFQLLSLHSLIGISISGENSETSTNSIYPSLQCLVLYDLPEFNGWSSKESDHNILEQYYFPVLTEVRIQGCPKMTSVPLVPKLESLKAVNVNVKMLNHLMFPRVIDPSLHVNGHELIEPSEHQHRLSHIKNLEIDGCKEFEWGDKPNGIDDNGDWHAFKSLNSLKLINIPELTSFPRNHQYFGTLKQLSLCWLANLKGLPEWIGPLTHLRQFSILYCPKLTMLSKFGGSFSALEQLEIRYCPRVCQFPESLPNLKRLQVQDFGRVEHILRVSHNLEELEISNCDELESETPSITGEASVRVWERLNCLHSLKLNKMDTYPKGLDFAKLPKLCRLVIEKCPKLTYLPETLCSISTLEHLLIHYCPGLINLPRNIKNLISLKKLEIRVSPQLEKRCKPGDADWSLIQHISEIVINDSPQQSGADC